MASGPAKLNQLRELLAKGIATVHLDARNDQVRVPRQLRVYDALPLSVSYGYAGMKLHLDDEDLCMTLSFARRLFRCFVPWSAVWGVTAAGGGGQVWLEDMPVSVLARIGEQIDAARMARRSCRPELPN